MPELGESDDVKQIALMTLGIDDTAEGRDTLSKADEANPSIALTKALRQFKEVISNNGSKG